MSMIKTAEGWRQLKPLFTVNPKLPREEPVRYRGTLPSQECIRYIWSLEIAHQEWVERRRELGLVDAPPAPKGRR